jgi:hypothetical protein
MNKNIALLLLICSQAVLSQIHVKSAETEPSDQIGEILKDAHAYNDQIDQLYLKIANGEGELCGPIPIPKSRLWISEKCSQGYKLG